MKSKYSPNKYDESFKREAVRLVTAEGRSAASVERDLGLGNGAISRWRKTLSEDSEHPFPGKGRLRLQMKSSDVCSERMTFYARSETS